ncbi:MAG TPA: shikimate kinase [Bryobacteraceae bacterium]
MPSAANKPGAVSAVALVGFMGAGKTTVGQALAQRLGWRFADLDQLIEASERRSIPRIFADEGEVHFRELERKALAQAFSLPDSTPLVLALGGGAFVSPSVRELLAELGIASVWLDAPVDELFRRCEQPDVVRPLRRDRRQFAQLHEQRLSSYRQADLHVVTIGKEISSIVNEVIQGLALCPVSRSSE